MIAERIYELLPTELPRVIGELPAASTCAVSIIEFDGNPSAEFFGGQQNSSIFSPLIKIVVRNTSYEVGSNWIEIIKDTLHRYHDDVLLSVLLVGSSMYLGRSPENLHEFQVTFSVTVKE